MHLACCRWFFYSALVAFGGLADSTVYGASPTAQQALRLTPIQDGVPYDQAGDVDVKTCTIRAEKVDGQTGWIVRTADGQILRRFADTNGDNVVDSWSYYQSGLETYRDIDANFNGKADQYRWFHTAGARWGLDQNEDGRIDRWRFISAEEVAAEVIEALKKRDTQRFTSLILTSKELQSLGLGANREKDLAAQIKAAPQAFKTLIAQQKQISSATKFLSFGGAQPGLVPAGTAGSSKDLVVYENVAALAETQGKSHQVNIGTLVSVGQVWRLIGVPQVASHDELAASGYFFQTSLRRTAGLEPQQPSGPTEKVQQMMNELEQLDRKVTAATPSEQQKFNAQRCDLLERLAEASKGTPERAQWVRQMADMASAAAQSGNFPQGVERLKDLETQLNKSREDKPLLAYVKFRRLSADYGLALQAPKADYAKIQEQWLGDLEGFVDAHPRSPDSAEAMLQLAITHEFAGDDDQSKSWYSRILKEFPTATPAKKAAGAKRRLESVGKAIPLRGRTIRGKTLDLARLRGKTVLIQYWATWCEPCKADMVELKKLQARYAKKGFIVLGVNLDNEPRDLVTFLKKNPLPWHQLYEPGGLESRFANEMGILTLPTMFLVDAKGRVVNRNIHVGELETELRKLR